MRKSTALAALALALASLIAAPAVARTGDGATQEKKAYETIVLKDKLRIERCAERGIGDNVLFIYSRYCPHCKKAMPVVEEIVTREKIGSRYLPVDASTAEGRSLLTQFGITAQFVPTLVKDCTAYVGAKKQEEYELILSTKGR